MKENSHPFKLISEEKEKVIRSVRGKYKNCFSSTEPNPGEVNIASFIGLDIAQIMFQ